MRTTFAIVIAVSVMVLAFLAGCSTNAQAKPDFSGTWIMTTEPAWMRMAAGPTPNHQFETVIKQSAIMISMSQRVILKATGKQDPKVRQPAASIMYLDGKERVTKELDGSMVKSRSVLEADALVITVTRTGTAPSTTTIRWTLDHTGHLLVENSLQTPKQARPAKSLTIYTKKVS